MSDQTTTQEQDTATETAAPEMWVPDEPTPTEAMARPEATEDTEGETPEVEAEAEVASEEKAAETTEQPKPQQQWNVPLQKMAQRQTTFEREVKQQIATLGDEIKGVLAEIKSQGGRATIEQKQQLQEAKDDLGELLSEVEKAELLDGPTFAKALRVILSKQGGSVDAETKQKLDAIQQEILATKQQQVQALEQQKAKQDWEALKSAHPEIDADALKAKAWEIIDSRYPDLADKDKMPLVRERFDAMLEVAKNKPKASTPAPKIDPASTTPPKSTKGTQTVPTGASTGRPASQGKRAKPPMYVED